MQNFINPEELNTILALGNGPVLLVSLDKNHAFSNQKQTLEELFNLFGERLQIVLLDIEYQNAVAEKFKVHGFPAFIFCERGRKKDALLGTPDPELLREFVIKNFFSNGNAGYESLQSN
jgi:thioredoxin-like negative regulator of GroEL